LSLRDAEVALKSAQEGIDKISKYQEASMVEIVFNMHRAAEETFKALLAELDQPCRPGRGERKDRVIDEKGFLEAWKELEDRLPGNLFAVAKWDMIRAWIDSTLLPPARNPADYCCPGLIGGVDAWNRALDIRVAQALLQQLRQTHSWVGRTISWIKQQPRKERK